MDVPAPPPPDIELPAAPSEEAADKLPVGERPQDVGDLVDFNVGDLDAFGQVGLMGTGFQPLTLVTAFVQWWELQASAEYGVMALGARGGLTLAVGGEVSFGGPALNGLAGLQTDEIDLDGDERIELDEQARDLAWTMNELSISGRASLHSTRLAFLDPFLVTTLGVTYTFADFIDSPPDPGVDAITVPYRSAGVRMSIGGGVNVLTKERWVLGGELRYVLSFRTAATSGLPIRQEDDDTLYGRFSFTNAQNPPSGFAWIVRAGRRF